MKAVLLHGKKDIREMIGFSLESGIPGLKIIQIGDKNEVSKSLQEGIQKPDLLIAEAGCEDHLSEVQKTTPLPMKLLLLNRPQDTTAPSIANFTFLGYAPIENQVDKILELLRPMAPVKGEDPSTEDSKYCRVGTGLLLKMNPLSADIFIRLSSTHYVKLFNQDDSFDERDLARYRDQKKIDYLYLQNKDSTIFVNKFVAELKKLLVSETPVTIKVVAEALNDGVEAIHEQIEKFGVTPAVQEAIATSVSVTMKTIGEFPKLGEILKQMKDHGGKYIGHHSTLLSSISCAIATAMDMYSDATFEKLTLASFLHDSTLRNNELCAVKELKEFTSKYPGKFSTAEVAEYKSHPTRAAALLAHFKNCPSEVDKLILQHHEHPLGVGFPGGLTSNYLTPLSCVFIVAHDFTDHVIDRKGNPNIEEFLTEFDKKYSMGHFKKIAREIARATLF